MPSLGVAMPLFGLPLKAVQDIDPGGELDGVEGSVGVALLVLDRLRHAGRTETRHGLGILVLAAGLGQVDGMTEDLTSSSISFKSRLAKLTH